MALVWNDIPGFVVAVFLKVPLSCDHRPTSGSQFSASASTSRLTVLFSCHTTRYLAMCQQEQQQQPGSRPRQCLHTDHEGWESSLQILKFINLLSIVLWNVFFPIRRCLLIPVRCFSTCIRCFSSINGFYMLDRFNWFILFPENVPAQRGRDPATQE